MSLDFSRRLLLKNAAYATALGRALSLQSLAGDASSSTEVMHEFAYRDVRLTGGPLKGHYDRIHAHYLSLDNNRLLKVYRQHAELDAPGKDMGGWYDTDGFVPGHSLGQYVSGLARLGSCTGDAACHEKVHALVDGFGAALDRNPNPYAGPNAEKVWPAYILDKHEIGLIDAYRLSGVDKAKTLLPRVIDGAKPFISPVSRDRIGKKDPPYDETYILPENLFIASEITGNRQFHDMAVKYLLDEEYFDPLARGEDVLPGKHAYSHVMALSSAGKAYLTLGDRKYKAALVNAWRFLELQRYASGGWGPDEMLVSPHLGALYDSLFNTKAHFETPCGSYASMKFARYLLRVTGDARYGDGLERVVYNTILGTKYPDGDGGYPYYSTYSADARKEFYPQKWPCCSGTLVQGVADYVLNLYFHSAGNLYVNMFAPSEVRWDVQGTSVRLVQETNYPADDKIVLRLTTRSAVAFTLHLRVPGWVEGSPNILVNGRPFEVAARPGSFVAIHRTWRTGDHIELRLPQVFRTEPIDELHKDTVALMKGPVMYVSLNQTSEQAMTVLPNPLGLSRLSRSQQTYTQSESSRDLVFVPFYQVQDEDYDTYFQQT